MTILALTDCFLFVSQVGEIMLTSIYPITKALGKPLNSMSLLASPFLFPLIKSLAFSLRNSIFSFAANTERFWRFLAHFQLPLSFVIVYNRIIFSLCYQTRHLDSILQYYNFHISIILPLGLNMTILPLGFNKKILDMTRHLDSIW